MNSGELIDSFDDTWLVSCHKEWASKRGNGAANTLWIMRVKLCCICADRKFWKKSFTLNRDEIPKFISEETALMILDCGKAVNFLRICGGGDVSAFQIRDSVSTLVQGQCHEFCLLDGDKSHGKCVSSILVLLAWLWIPAFREKFQQTLKVMFH